jgi:peptidoglycan/xylan/chitin deacetylase (PgdA/CDA1 family)
MVSRPNSITYVSGISNSQGHILNNCAIPGTVALTFDDGPFNYTDRVLDILASHGAKATFFICGNNNPVGAIDDPTTPWAPVLRRMHADGHQLASHTWTHANLSEATARVRRQQVVYNEMALRNLFGAFPTYIRPPYASCTAESGCVQDLSRWGYHVINYDLDTRDFLNDSPEGIRTSMDLFDRSLAAADPRGSSFIVLSHDVKKHTAEELTEHMLRTLKSRGYRAVTVGECLGDPRENWYRAAPRDVNHEDDQGHEADNSNEADESDSDDVHISDSGYASGSDATGQSSSSENEEEDIPRDSITTTGRCGAKNGLTCKFSGYGHCCSSAGYW